MASLLLICVTLRYPHHFPRWERAQLHQVRPMLRGSNYYLSLWSIHISIADGFPSNKLNIIEWRKIHRLVFYQVALLNWVNIWEWGNECLSPKGSSNMAFLGLKLESLYFISWMLKMELLPKSLKRPMTFALSTIISKISNGSTLWAHNFIGPSHNYQH